MKNLVDYLKESLHTQYINEGASVESVIMFLNRWNGKCVKICDFPYGTDVKQFTQDLIDEYGEDEYISIEYCEDCDCIVIKQKVCKNCDDCPKIKYNDLFKDNSLFVKEGLSHDEEEFKNMYLKVIKDWDNTQDFNHLKEIADNDIKLKRVYKAAKKFEQTHSVSIHDALYSLIRHGKV